MSSSESCSEDDFESADEGDSTDDYVIISNVENNQIQIKANESASNIEQKEKEVSSGPTLDDKSKIPVNLDCDKFSEKIVLEDELKSESSVQSMMTDKLSHPVDQELDAFSEKANHEDQESENGSCIEFITMDDKSKPNNLTHQVCSESTDHIEGEAANISDIESVIKSEKQESETKPFIPLTEICQDPPIPAVFGQSSNHSKQEEDTETTQLPEIITEISTRKISSRVRRDKPRSTLGAKKLGAIRIPNESSSSEMFLSSSASTLMDSEKETIEPKYFPEVATKEYYDQTKFDDQPVKEVSSSGGWGWFSPPTSLISSVSALTTQILSTVETGFNIPEPEELAKEDMTAACASESGERQDDWEGSSIGFNQLVGGVSNLTRFVENTGSMVFSSGLDTLELIGKKTYTALQQSDPGFKKTKAVLNNPIQGSNDLPSLSQVLRDAKEENVACFPEQSDIKSHGTAKTAPLTLNTLLEQFHCFAHVEALEMLSQQCNIRISPQMHRLTIQRKAILEEIHQICTENPDENLDGDELFYIEVLDKNLSSALAKIGIQLSIERLMNAFSRGTEKTYESVDSSKKIYEDALKCLAEITSLSLELMHKCAELLLLPKAVNMKADVKMEAQVLQNITFTIVKEISNVGSQYASEIIKTETRMQTSSNYSTDIYYEASNCSSYLLNALKSMSPVFKARTFQ